MSQKIRVQVMFHPELYNKLQTLINHRNYKNFSDAIQSLYEEAKDLREENHLKSVSIMDMNKHIQQYEKQIQILSEKLQKSVKIKKSRDKKH